MSFKGEYSGERHFSGNPWSADEFHARFYEKTRNPDRPHGITSYSELPSAFDAAHLMGHIEAVFQDGEDLYSETAVLTRAENGLQFPELLLIGGSETSVRMNDSTAYRQSQILIHVHPTQFKEFWHERERNAIHQPKVNDYPSGWDSTKLIISEVPWDCFATIHKRSVTFLLRSHETPSVSLKTFKAKAMVLGELIRGDLTLLFLRYTKYIQSIDTDDTPLPYFTRNRVVEFVQQNRIGLYQIPNFLRGSTAVRIG